MIIINNVVIFDQNCDCKFGFVACATEINLFFFFLDLKIRNTTNTINFKPFIRFNLRENRQKFLKTRRSY